jgi:hypothetical protein
LWLWIFKTLRIATKLEPVDALTPGKVFAARWAMALLGGAMNRLRQEYAIGHNAATFEMLKAFLEVGTAKNRPATNRQRLRYESVWGR